MFVYQFDEATHYHFPDSIACAGEFIGEYRVGRIELERTNRHIVLIQVKYSRFM